LLFANQSPLMTRIWIHIGIAVIVALLNTSGRAAVFNLASDWSTINNPNGAWSYRAGTSNLPAQSSSSLDSWATPQPGWAPAPGASLPFEFKSNGTENFVHDWLAGDVVTHANN